jgi:hypothetical protein
MQTFELVFVLRLIVKQALLLDMVLMFELTCFVARIYSRARA